MTARVWLVVGLLALAGVMPPAARAANPASVPVSSLPNDPAFAQCEGQFTNGVTDFCFENWLMFGPISGPCPAPGGALVAPRPDGTLPCFAPGATDPQHSAGADFTGAWAQGNVGRPSELVAYIEGGINYDDDTSKDFVDNVYLNAGELPYPQHADGTSCGAYDCNGDGRLNVADYAADPRVNPACAAGAATHSTYAEGVRSGCVAGGKHAYIDAVNVAGKRTPYLSPEDLIAVFGHCQVVDHRIGPRGCPAGGRFDNDGNGYPGDVSGWNFDRNDDDPQTDETGYYHAGVWESELADVANNHYDGVGLCRECALVPIKQGTEPLGTADGAAQAILYATDLGCAVIDSTVVTYEYASVEQQAVDYANRHGVLMAMDANDFDSMDHTDGMLLNHAIPGNSLYTAPVAAFSKGVTSFRARSDISSYGTHNVFSGENGSTSGATPYIAGVLAAVASAGLMATDRHVIPSRLEPDEVKQVVMDTASPVIPQTQTPQTPSQWPGNPDSATDADHTNWSTQYGYGRPDVGAATAMVLAGHLPPTAELTSPHWFAYVDPARRRRLVIDGAVARSRVNSGGQARWTLEWALGADPADADFHTIAGGATEHRSGRLGVLDLARLPRSYADKAPGDTLPPTGPEQYTVTLRLRVVDANGLKAEDRRSFGLRHDPTLLPGFPRHYGAEISGAPIWADLEGRHQQDLIFSTYDGVVHALRPSGHELPGYPVRTDLLRRIDPRNPEHARVGAYRLRRFRDLRDPVTGVAVGDLFHDGWLEVVADSSNADVYAWNARGHRLAGFRRPRTTLRRYWRLPVPTPHSATPFSRLPQRGAYAPPVLADLEGTGRLDVLMSAYDGHVYAWRPNGRAVPGWPVEVTLPAGGGVDRSTLIRDPKLVTAPAVGPVVPGTQRPQVFVASYDCNGVSAPTQAAVGAAAGLQPPGGGPPPTTWVYGIWGDGRRHAGGAYLPGWPAALHGQLFCSETSIDFVGEGSTAPVIGDIKGHPGVVSGSATGPPDLISAAGAVSPLDNSCPDRACGADGPYRLADRGAVTLTERGALGPLHRGGGLDYVQSEIGLTGLELFNTNPGTAVLPTAYTQAWDTGSGEQDPGYPRRQDGLTFLDAPLVANVGGASANQTVEANDSYWIHAFDAAGGEAPGFPKYTGQWPGTSGALGTPRFDGHQVLAWGTREGQLFAWSVRGATASAATAWPRDRHDDRNSSLYGSDATRPAVVTGLRVDRAGGALRVRWRATGDDGVVGRVARYRVTRGRARITVRRPSATLPCGPGRVTVTAIDAAGNRSATRSGSGTATSCRAARTAAPR